MKKFPVLFFIFISTRVISQGVDNLWLMGYENYNPLPLGGTNVNYITGTPNVYFEPNRTMQIRITSGLLPDKVDAFSTPGVGHHRYKSCTT